jgi:cytochrome P450
VTAFSTQDIGLFQPPAVEPDPNADGFVGLVRAMVNNPVSAFPAEVYAELMTINSRTGKQFVFICDPAIIEEILIKRSQDFPKSLVDERVLRPAFGDSLLTAHGESWRWKRRLAAPYFAPAALAKLVPDMVRPFEKLTEQLTRRNDPRPVEISGAMTRATLEVITSTLFTSSDELDMDAVSEAIADYLTPISWTISLASFGLPAWLPHPGRAKLLRGRDRMRKLVGDLISRRRQSASEYQDICSDLMQAHDPVTKEELSDTDLVDMLLTLVAAGHETSANALTWTMYCLAMQPNHQSELRDEVETVAGDDPITATHLPQLVKTEAFLKEAMRLFPPVPLIARQSTKSELFAGHRISAGTTLFIPIYAVHRHERLLDAPKLFAPSRFAGKKAKQILRTAYMPFGAGPRICIGATFAMMEMVAGLATILRLLNFEPTSSTVCDPISRVTLRPRDGMVLEVKRAA